MKLAILVRHQEDENESQRTSFSTLSMPPPFQKCAGGPLRAREIVDYGARYAARGSSPFLSSFA
jgi:hypothetical protein